MSTMTHGPEDRRDSGKLEPVTHPYLQTQLSYDHALDVPPPYTRALWDQEHSWICDDINRLRSESTIRLLDVGCGPGHFSERLSHCIDLYVGVDPSLMELKRVNALPRRFLIRGIGEQLDFLSDNYFDAVLLISVLDHCIDWKKTINRCCDLLRPGGVMIVAVENSDNLLNRCRGLLRRPVNHPGHMHYLTIGDIAGEVSRSLMTLKVKTFGYGFGLHSLTRRIPIPRVIFDALMPITDAVGRVLWPMGGQVVYGCYQKPRNESAQASAHFLVCPACKVMLNWRQSQCERCGGRIPYHEDILDGFALSQARHA